MLRVNVGLSRKVSKDYNSTGYSINIDGEVTASISDAEAVIEEVKQLYDLAEEALALQIERSTGEGAIASRDEHRPPAEPAPQRGNGRPPAPENRHAVRTEERGREAPQDEEPATSKQVQYLLSIGKRRKISTLQLEYEIEQILGQQVGVYDLGKRQAAKVIEALAGTVSNSNGNGRR